MQLYLNSDEALGIAGEQQQSQRLVLKTLNEYLLEMLLRDNFMKNFNENDYAKK